MQLNNFFVLLSGLCLFSCTSTSPLSPEKKVQSPAQVKAQRFILNDGLQVSLAAPQGFLLTPEHYGFIQPESFSRIKVYEVEVPYQTYLASLTKARLAQHKLQLVAKQAVTVENAECELLDAKQAISGTVFDKQLLICGDQLSSVVVETSYPESARSHHKEAVHQSLMSLNVKAENKLRLFTGLPFRLTQTPGYRITKRFGNSVVMVPQSTGSEKSSVVISHGTSENASIEELAEQIISKGLAPTDIEIRFSEQTQLKHMPALGTEAFITVAGESFWMKQILSYQGNRFLLIQCLVPRAEKATAEQKFANLLQYFEFK